MAIGVPGEIRAYEYAHKHFGGKLPWKALFEPTIKLCRDGFIISPSQAAAIRQSERFIRNDPGLKLVHQSSFVSCFYYEFICSETFVKNDGSGKLYDVGDMIKRPKLATTLEIIANESADAFYNGSLSDLIVEEISERGGIITRKDLLDYDLDVREAIKIELNDSFVAYTTHAPSSGPILAFMLNILQGM